MAKSEGNIDLEGAVLLNPELPTVEGVDLGRFYEEMPGSIVGDLAYAMHLPNKNKLFLVIMRCLTGAGEEKGLMERVKKSIDSNLRTGPTLRYALVKSNELLNETNAYAVGKIAELDLEENILTLASAGGNKLIHCFPRRVMTPEQDSFMMGFADNQKFSSLVPLEHIRLGKGHYIILYTKGLISQETEEDGSRLDFGEQRLKQLIYKEVLKSPTAAELNHNVMAVVKEFFGDFQGRYNYALLTMRVLQ